MQKRPHLQNRSAQGAVKPFCWWFGKLTLVLDRQYKTWGMKPSKKFSTGRKMNGCWREQREEVEERWHLKRIPFPPIYLMFYYLIYTIWNLGRVLCFVGRFRFVAIYIFFPANMPRNCYWQPEKASRYYFRESLGTGKRFFPDFRGNTRCFFKIPAKWKQKVPLMVFLQISPCSLTEQTLTNGVYLTFSVWMKWLIFSIFLSLSHSCFIISVMNFD